MYIKLLIDNWKGCAFREAVKRTFCDVERHLQKPKRDTLGRNTAKDYRSRNLAIAQKLGLPINVPTQIVQDMTASFKKLYHQQLYKKHLLAMYLKLTI